MGMDALRYAKPWGTGSELSFGGPATAGLMVRWPGVDGGQGQCCVFMPRHALLNYAHPEDLRLGAEIRQPMSGAVVGAVLAAAEMHVYSDCADDVTPDVADLAVVAIRDADAPRRPNVANGPSMDRILDNLYQTSVTAGDRANWIAAPRDYDSWTNRPLCSFGAAPTYAPYPRGLSVPRVGTRVRWTGAVSGTHWGTIVRTEADTWVEWTHGKLSRMGGLCWVLVEAGAKLQRGDSGAAAFDESHRCVGGLVTVVDQQAAFMPYQAGIRQLLGARAAALRLEE